MTFAIFENTLAADKATSYYFTNPQEEIVAYHSIDIPATLLKIEQLSQQGLYLVGYIAYDTAEFFLPHLSLQHPANQPLIHFIAFKSAKKFAANQLDRMLPNISAKKEITFNYLELAHDYSEYRQQYTAVIKELTAGNSYQLNLTLPVTLYTNPDDNFALYYQLSRSHPVNYACFLPFLPQTIISISPELFFQKKRDVITVRPMKGTMPRGKNSWQDMKNNYYLQTDGKNRSENLIIVDLLRNDLAKFATTGSVTVPKLFTVEKYASVWQMTSTIKANITKNTSLSTILAGLFPCGSISGAPKLRTVQLIEQIENYRRVVYCGSCGYILPNNDMLFNVAIRTLSTLETSPGQYRLGVGGGITVQSKPEEEWQEINTKLGFVRKFYQPNFNLIESLRIENKTPLNLQSHLQRLNNSAEKLGFNCHIKQIAKKIREYCQKNCEAASNYKQRVELSYFGKLLIEHHIIESIHSVIKVAIYPQPINTSHGLFQHKTTSSLTRGLYTQIDKDYKPPGIDELIYVNQDGIVTESRFHNVIIILNKQLLTSPTNAGLLPGIFRERWLQTGALIETPLTVTMLQQAETIYLCNDVRGMLKTELVEYTDL